MLCYSTNPFVHSFFAPTEEEFMAGTKSSFNHIRIWFQKFCNNGKPIAGQSINFPRRITGYGHFNISRMHELHSMEWSTESIADIDRFRHDCHGNYSDIRMCIWSSFESGRNHCCGRLRSAKYSGNWRIGDLQTMTLRSAIIVFCHSFTDGMSLLSCANVRCVHGIRSSFGHNTKWNIQSE